MAYSKTKHKAYKDLTFTDDYMFCKVLQNDMELCRKLLEVLLGIEIKRVTLVDSQHVLTITSDIKSVRLDVYLNDDAETVYDVEMQALRERELPKRSRYYQSIADIDHLGAGDDYGDLPKSYVVFICMFDPYYRGFHKYEFRNLCVEDPSIELNDETYKVFINARSKETDMSPDMRALLDYLCSGEPGSELTREIDDSILNAKTNLKWEKEYMLVRDIMKKEREEGRLEGLEEGLEKGRIEGLEEGQNRMAEVNKYLLSQKRYDDLLRASEDPEFCEQIIVEMCSNQNEEDQ